MQTSVDEIAKDWYRISTYSPTGIQFNEFLLRDEQPFLMHTGLRRLFPETLRALSTVIDPAALRWIGFSHFEPDECGALNEWLQVAPHAETVCSFVGARMLMDFAERPARALADNEVLVTGRHRLRFLATPYVPHCWDAGLFFDETTRLLTCSDLFFHPGNPVAITTADIVAPARAALVAGLHSPAGSGFPYTTHTDATLQRLADLQPQVLAVMHGSSFRGDGGAAIRTLASTLRELLAPPATFA